MVSKSNAEDLWFLTYIALYIDYIHTHTHIYIYIYTYCIRISIVCIYIYIHKHIYIYIYIYTVYNSVFFGSCRNFKLKGAKKSFGIFDTCSETTECFQNFQQNWEKGFQKQAELVAFGVRKS